MSITIKKITEEEWQEFSKIRLKALQTDPKVFGSNYERESEFSEDDWRERLRSVEKAVFMLFDGETPIGMTGVAIDDNDPTGKTALLWGSWLTPEYRGRGLSGLMYKARIDWAKNNPAIEKILVSHRASNLASKFANQRHGFKFTETHEKLWTDNVTEDDVCYELLIVRD